MRKARSLSACSLLLTTTVLLTACKGAEQVCDPTDPLCGNQNTQIDLITVSSAIDSVMAVGRTAQLSAVASRNGGTVSATFTWSSTNPSVATVNSTTGLVTAVGPGRTEIRARASGVTGSQPMRAVAADLDEVAGAIDDAFFLAMNGSLTGSTASTINGHLTPCGAALAAGHVLAVDACLAAALTTTGADGTDNALLGVMSLFLDYARQQLQLGA